MDFFVCELIKIVEIQVEELQGHDAANAGMSSGAIRPRECLSPDMGKVAGRIEETFFTH